MVKQRVILEGRPKGPRTTLPYSRPYYDFAAQPLRVIVRAGAVRLSGGDPWVALQRIQPKKKEDNVRILIIRPGAIGDALLAFHILKILRARNADPHITL